MKYTEKAPRSSYLLHERDWWEVDPPHPDPFLQAVLVDPDDDAPRLIYADWLEERGDPRAEFIRAQCTAARLDPKDARRGVLEERGRQLLAGHHSAWCGPMRNWVDFWAFERGFMEEISVRAPLFLERAADIFQLAPIQVVHVSQARDYLLDLAGCPYLSRLRFLDLTGNTFDDAEIESLLDSPHLGRLAGINLGGVGLGDRGAQALADCPHLAELTELYLGDNLIGDRGAQALAASLYLSRLRTLFLDNNAIGGAADWALRQSYGSRVHLENSRSPYQGLALTMQFRLRPDQEP